MKKQYKILYNQMCSSYVLSIIYFICMMFYGNVMFNFNEYNIISVTTGFCFVASSLTFAIFFSVFIVTINYDKK